jgi:putative spermidine/putrescine transport system substrate-binding protein
MLPFLTVMQVVGETTVRKRKRTLAVAAIIGSAVLAVSGCGSSGSSSSSGGTGTSGNWSKADSAAAGGGMAALIKAAEKEGQLNVITLPSNWANYGTIMSDFSKLYHIHITDANPEGSSGQEITAVQQLKGQSRAPDVVDGGTPFAVEGVT